MAYDAAISLDQPVSCCGHKHSAKEHSQETMAEKVFYLAERLSAVALGVFSAAVFPVFFFPMFAFGTLLGLAIPGESAQRRGPVSSCSQGFLEQTLGVKLPDSVALAAGFAVTAVHIDHHPDVFARIAGVTVGMKTGQLVRAGFDLCYRKIAAYRS